MPLDPGVSARSFRSLDFIIHCMPEEFWDYRETSQAASDRMGRPFSNVVGGLGLFTITVKSERTGYLLNPVSLDSLVDGRFTWMLDFQKW